MTAPLAPYAAIALSTDTSIIKAIENDYNYEQIFERQVQALVRPGDKLLALSTSSESRNLVQGAEATRQQDVTVVPVTGPGESLFCGMADCALRTPGAHTATV